MAKETWYYPKNSSYVAVTIDWQWTETDTSVTIKPIIYRWDQTNTTNSGDTFTFVLNPDPAGTGTYTGNSWGTGYDTRPVKEFGTARTYQKTTSAQTVSLKVSTTSSFGTYYSGSFHTLGSWSNTWTKTIPALAHPDITIKYNANGGSGTMSNTIAKYGSAVTISPCTFTRSGYTFDCWGVSTSDVTDEHNWTDWSGTWKYTNGQYGISNNTLNLYAIWKRVYKVNLYDNNDAVWWSDSVIESGSTIVVLPSTYPSLTGHSCSGWTAGSGNVDYFAGQRISLSGDLHLYPVFTPNTYAVNYNANGGTGAPSAQTKTYGVNLTLSSTVPTRDGYDFQGWGTSSGDTTVDYAAGATYSTNAAITLYAIWKIKTYTISYNANGGSGAPSAQTKNHGSNITLSSTKPTRTGHTFQGWGTSSGDTTVDYAAGATYSANAGITLYAIWKIDTYAVSYNANGGSGAPSSQTKTYGVNLTLSSTKPTKSSTTGNGYTVTYNYNGGSGSPASATSTRTTNYSFSNWNTSSNGSGTTYSSGGTYTANTAVTLYAQYSVSSTSESALSLPTPTRAGHDFAGWYSDSGLTKFVGNAGASYTPSANITLYAKWNIHTWKVYYNANGGTGAPAEQTKTYNANLTLSSTKPTKASTTGTGYTVTYNYNSGSGSPASATSTRTTNYSFNNWNTAANGSGTTYNSGATYTANSGATLYAQYIVSSTSESALTLPTPSRTGYTFDGWYSNSSLTTKVGNAGASYTPNSNITLYAKWNIIQYTISYNANGGTGAPANQTKNYGTNITLSSTKPTKASENSNGYTVTYNYNGGSGSPASVIGINTTSYAFKNWNTAANGSGTSYSSGATYSANSGATLYAQWTPTTVRLPVTLPTPTRANYNFNGWYSNSSLTTKVGDAGASYTPSSNVTLYAKWSLVTYTVSFNANGGSGAPSAQTKTYGTSLTLSSTIPARDGYNFLGWSTSSTATSATYSAGGNYTAESSTTLYAVWQLKTYSVSFNANGGSGAPSAQTKTHGVTLTLSSTKPTRAGYAFQGWGTSASDTSVDYAAGGSYTSNSAITLYAIWKATSIITVYDSNGNKRAGYVVAYDANGNRREVILSAYDSSGARHSVI